MFFLSFFGLINYSRNLVAFMVYLELLYLNISFLFIVISGSLFNMFGELFSFLLLSIAACEAAIGFSILILLLNKQGTIFLKDFHNFHG
jgi:NADH-quinone oxidoreductase subunit K